MAEWISVKERLPELDQEVLVYAVGKIDGFIGSSVFALCLAVQARAEDDET